MDGNIYFASSVSAVPGLLDETRAMLKSAIAEGVIPASRPDITGDEDVVFSGGLPEHGGFAIWFPTENGRAWLDILYVVPSDRHTGIGSRLVEAVLRRARDAGLAGIDFGTLLANAPMQQMAEGLGFARVGFFYSLDMEQPDV